MATSESGTEPISDVVRAWAADGATVTFRETSEGYIVADSPLGQYWFWGQGGKDRPDDLCTMQVL